MDSAQSEFGKSFIKNYNKRIRQHLSQCYSSSKPSPSYRRHSPTPPPPPPPPSSSSQSQSEADSHHPKYDYLYSKNNRANILNVVSQISDDVTSNPGIPMSAEKISLDDAEYLGRGATMEVFAVDYSPQENKGSEAGRSTTRKVAVKRVSREHAPVRNHALALEEDFVFLKGRDAFYARVGAMTQEIKILAREPIYGHRNIVHLHSLAWDEMPDIGPDFRGLFQTRQNQQRRDFDDWGTDCYSLIADIADGLAMLHHCEVLHSDLKPSNILLFQDSEEKGLVAKIGDFGFADVDLVLARSLDPAAGSMVGVGRGQTREWAAPEMLQSCTMRIKRLASTVPVARDIYSFGLLIAYIVLNGKSPRQLVQSDGNSIEEQNEELDRLKIDDLLQARIEEEVRLHWKSGSEREDENRMIVLDQIREIVTADPTARPSSLSDVRRKVMGYDPYSTQKHQDRFKIVPFTNMFSTEMAYSNLFQTITGISNRILESLPANLMAELRGLVGEEPAIYEPVVHTIRRLTLQRQLGELETKDGEEGGKSPLDRYGGKYTLDALRTTLSWIPDLYELIKVVGGYPFSVPHAEYDFLRTEYQDRPLIFTLTDGNNVHGVRRLLMEDPSQVNARLPDDSGGWSPIHLAACLGRTKIMKLILQTHLKVNPNMRSVVSQVTPLHQAVIGRHPGIAEMLLRAGAQVDARYYIPNLPYGRLRELSPLELAVEQCVSQVTKDDERIIEMLLRAGADYLHNSGGRGYSIVFKASAHVEILKIFFETIPAEDAKHLANIRDNDRQTLLFHAVNRVDVEKVKYLLSRGVDPRVRCVSGQTAYTRLRSASYMGSTGPGLLIQTSIMAVTHKLPTPEGIEQVLQLLEKAAGPDGMAADDYSFSAQEVEDMQKNFKSEEPITKEYFESDRFQKKLELLLGIMDNPLFPTAYWLFRLDNVSAIEALKKNLEQWYTRRRQGLIGKDILPDGWEDFFTEPEKNSPNGFWKVLIKEEDIPALAKFMKTSAISLAERFMDNNGSMILEKMIPAVEEMTLTRAFDIIFDSFSIIFQRMILVFMKGFRFTFVDKIIVYQRLKQTWRALAQYEVLDRLHDVAVALGIDGSINEFARGMLVEDIDVDLAIPPDAIETLRLAQRYPDATIFITSKTIDIPPKRFILSIHQLVLFLLPAFMLCFTLYIEFLCLRASSLWAILLARVWYNGLLPKDWILIDNDGHLHPNIFRGIFAALELIWFRIRCPWIHITVGEPLILALRPGAMQVDVPIRLQHMRKETQWPVYRLSLRRKWMNGGLPRKAWCDGWWEKKIDGKWERVNANGKPTWTEYTEATKEIQRTLFAKGCVDGYYHFLEQRDYWLNTPGQQLLSLQEVFGEEHAECLEIWQKLFLRDSSARTWIGRSDSPSPWWNRFVLKKFVDGIWSTWDAGLLDKVGY
uniref:Serine/threonine-protein kinase/endoribonuclease IRE2 n=1 Tax=Talaromyces marneffei PM1 TaxID=1077442 RepID=A0A093XHD2_TALMA